MDTTIGYISFNDEAEEHSFLYNRGDYNNETTLEYFSDNDGDEEEENQRKEESFCSLNEIMEGFDDDDESSIEYYDYNKNRKEFYDENNFTLKSSNYNEFDFHFRSCMGYFEILPVDEHNIGIRQYMEESGILDAHKCMSNSCSVIIYDYTKIFCDKCYNEEEKDYTLSGPLETMYITQQRMLREKKL